MLTRNRCNRFGAHKMQALHKDGRAEDTFKCACGYRVLLNGGYVEQHAPGPLNFGSPVRDIFPATSGWGRMS